MSDELENIEYAHKHTPNCVYLYNQLYYKSIRYGYNDHTKIIYSASNGDCIYMIECKFTSFNNR